MPAPVWLNDECPGWFEEVRFTEEGLPVWDSTFGCISCDGRIALGSACCETCGLIFYKPTELDPVPEAAEEELDESSLVAYSVEELSDIVVSRAQAIYGITIEKSIADALARISQGTAANAITLMENVVRTAQAENKGALTGAQITTNVAKLALKRMGRDPWVGLDRSQRKYLVALAGDGARGLSAASLASLAGEKVLTVETMIEPFLLQRSGLPYFNTEHNGWYKIEGAFVEQTKSGRKPTELTYKYLEIAQAQQASDPDWFAGENLFFGDALKQAPDTIPDVNTAVAQEPTIEAVPPLPVPPTVIATSPPVTPKFTTAPRTRSKSLWVWASIVATGVIAVIVFANQPSSYRPPSTYSSYTSSNPVPAAPSAALQPTPQPPIQPPVAATPPAPVEPQPAYAPVYAAPAATYQPPEFDSSADRDAAVACQSLGYSQEQYQQFKQELAAVGTPTGAIPDYVSYLANASAHSGANFPTVVAVGTALVADDGVGRAEQKISILSKYDAQAPGVVFKLALDVSQGRETAGNYEAILFAVGDPSGPVTKSDLEQVLTGLQMHRR